MKGYKQLPLNEKMRVHNFIKIRKRNCGRGYEGLHWTQISKRSRDLYYWILIKFYHMYIWNDKTISFKQRLCQYYCMLTKRREKKQNRNCTKMLWSILKKSWRQHPTKQQLYSHLPPISQTIQVRRTRHARYSWRRKDELISNVLQWTSLHGRPNVGRPVRTYRQQRCTNTGCNTEELLERLMK